MPSRLRFAVSPLSSCASAAMSFSGSGSFCARAGSDAAHKRKPGTKNARNEVSSASGIARKKAIAGSRVKASLPRVQCAAMCALILAVAAAGGYSDLVTLFGEWRAFQKPALVDGVPDYTPAAMARQHAGLKAWQKRLAALDPRAWPVPQQVDWHIVRAEMNGLDFDHRVLQPVGAQPGFYVTVFTDESDQPAREGPLALGAVEVFALHTAATMTGELARRLARRFPRSRAGAGEPDRQRARPLGVRNRATCKAQRAALADAGAARLRVTPALTAAVQKAQDATDALRRVARSAGAVEDRPVRHRRRELRLVPRKRAARAATRWRTRSR